MGKHRDNEPELDPATPVVSLSLGATRDFVLHRGGERLVLPLAHGELLAMDAPTNDLWHHSLPPRKKVAAPRLNLTFRQLDPAKATATAARAAKQRATTGVAAQAH
jgi:alkylated DNA repair dioxygenase AlkB